MTKVTVKGEGSRLVANIVTKALRDAGIKTNSWYDATPSEIGKCARAASKEDAAVSVVALRGAR